MYEYQAYPMWITRPDGSKCIVNDRDEHELIMTGKIPETMESQMKRIREYMGLSEAENIADYVTGILEKPEAPRRGRSPKVNNGDHDA